jgi:hypothetical protein
MPDDPNTITLALVLTAAGATIAAALVTGVVQLLKQIAPFIGNGRERVTAFILSGILVIVAVASGVQDSTITLSIASVFAAVVAWYGIARLSMAVFADATKETNSLTGPPAP